MTKQNALLILQRLNALLPELQRVISALPNDDISRKVRKVRRTTLVDNRLYRPIEELDETAHVRQYIDDMARAGITCFKSGELLSRLVPDRTQHNNARKAVLRHILQGLGYEYVSVRVDGQISKAWRRKIDKVNG